jgi:hypothetical protein
VSNSEDQKRNQQPPYLDPSLVIDTRLSEIERQQREDKADSRKHERSQRNTNRLLTLFTGLLFVTSVISDILMLRYVGLTKESAVAATTLPRRRPSPSSRANLIALPKTSALEKGWRLATDKAKLLWTLVSKPPETINGPGLV